MFANVLLLTATLIAGAPLAVASDAAGNPIQSASVNAAQPAGAAEFAGDLGVVRAGTENAAPADSNDICYKIRAYIFKRDDDHAPKLVGSTTCGPKQPRARAADWPKARLIPAK